VNDDKEEVKGEEEEGEEGESFTRNKFSVARVVAPN
jgi:hypothetical protein